MDDGAPAPLSTGAGQGVGARSDTGGMSLAAWRHAHDALTTRWHVAVVAGPDAGWCHPVTADGPVVGRDPAGDLVLADPTLSRRHVAFRERHGRVEARDLASANGTRVRRPSGRRRAEQRRNEQPTSEPPSGERRRWGRRWWGRRRPRRGVRLRSRWRRLPAAGAELCVGSTVLRVRERPGLRADGVAVTAPPPEPADDSRRGGPSPRDGALLGRLALPVLVTAVSLPVLLVSSPSGPRLALLLLLAPVALLGALALGGTGRRAVPAVAPDPAAVLLAALGGGRWAPARDAGRGDVRVHLGAGAIDVLVEGPVAVVGDIGATRAAARWLVCQLATRLPPQALSVRIAGVDGSGTARTSGTASASASEWAWAAPLPHGEPGGERLLTVLDPALVPVGAPPPGSPTDDAVLVLAGALTAVPRWCRRVVEVGPADGAVSPAWAACVAQGLAATTRAALPDVVPAGRYLPDPVRAWPTHDAGLVAVLGVGADGPVEIDLARDGPHALVAGTTGSGKSELLLSWLLALACRYPPAALSIVAFDFKGGATFGPVTTLPHTAGVLTDLDRPAAARALAGLQAELVRRERLLASAGARDLDELRRRRAASDTDPPGRLLVAVDEFRVLADEHPDLLDGLVRLAAQGRSLGIHLVLATQRPAGAVTADMRANLALAVCLRVTSPADSLDVLGVPDAARLPRVPGRALVAGSPAAGDGLVEIQTAWCGGAETTLVAAVEAAAVGHRRASRLWAPALPACVRIDLGAVGTGASAPPRTDALALPLLLLDRPAQQRLTTWAWSPARSPLLIVGGPRTGRSTALATTAAAALHSGLPVHLVGPAAEALREVAPAIAEHPCLGTVVGPGDPRRLSRLLDLLAESGGPALVCIDDVESVLDALEHSDGADRLTRLVRDGRSTGLGVAIAGGPGCLASRWASGAHLRVVLAPTDAAEAALAGVPRALVQTHWPPGRGVLLGAGDPLLAQVGLPDPRADEPYPPAPGRVLRLAELPRDPCPRELARRDGSGSALLFGVGGDDAEPVRVEAGAGARILVAGPPGSGRTSVLAWLADCLTRRERRITWLSGPDGGSIGRAPAAGCPDGGSGITGPDPTDLDPTYPDPTDLDPTDLDATDPHAVLLVDDADGLSPHASELAARAWRASAGVVVVAVRTDALATAFRGLLGDLRTARCTLLLAPLRGGPGHLSAADVLRHADPGWPRHPGRGVLVEAGRVLAVQVPAADGGRPGR